MRFLVDECVGPSVDLADDLGILPYIHIVQLGLVSDLILDLLGHFAACIDPVAMEDDLIRSQEGVFVDQLRGYIDKPIRN